MLIVTASPPVSPSVVASILMIQKPSVTAGTLERAAVRVLVIEILIKEKPTPQRAGRVCCDCSRRSIRVRAFRLIFKDLPCRGVDADLLCDATASYIKRIAKPAAASFPF